MQNSKSIYDIYDNTMETRTVQSDQITTTTIGLTTRTEGGSSSADETCVTKKKAKKRDRSPSLYFLYTFNKLNRKVSHLPR